MKILIAGDYCPLSRVASILELSNYNVVLGEIKPITALADYSILNYECPICCGDEKPILKAGPNHKSKKSGLNAIKWAGFDCVTLANNHFRDFGNEGCINTISELKNACFDFVGGGQNFSEASQVFYKEIGNSSLAVVNCCENEFSIASTKGAGSNPLNPIQQYYQIQEARKLADYVVVIVHGGTEWYNLPTPRMKETYRFFIDVGADAVVNHHQHCYSGYEVYKEKPIFYGLGNFCFDKGAQKPNFWNEGFMVMLDLKQEGIGYQLFPYVQCAEEPTVRMLEDASVFNKKIERLNQIIADEKLLKKKFHELAQGRKKTIRGLLTPYSTRIMKSLYAHGLLPSFVTTNREISLLAHTQCESHRDLLIDNLKYSIE